MPITPKAESNKSTQKPIGNRYNRAEWAGAFGDLGTLIPFIIGYISIMKLDPLGVLFMFGILLIGSGLYYKTPIPIQPMKAIGGAAITQTEAITPGMVWGAGIFTGLFWLILGLTGTRNYVSKIATKGNSLRTWSSFYHGRDQNDENRFYCSCHCTNNHICAPD